MKKIFERFKIFIIGVFFYLIVPIFLVFIFLYLLDLGDKWADKTIGDIEYNFTKRVEDFCKGKMTGKLYTDAAFNEETLGILQSLSSGNLNDKQKENELKMISDFRSFYLECINFYNRDLYVPYMKDSIKGNFCKGFGDYFYDYFISGQEKVCLDNRDNQFRGAYSSIPLN